MNDKVGDITFEQNSDGTFTLSWNREDPQWAFLNSLTSAEIQSIIQNEIKLQGLRNE